MESPRQDGLQNDGLPARVVWPVVEGFDDLESMFSEEADTGLDAQLEILGEHLYSIVGAATILIRNSRRAELSNDDFEADGDNFIIRKLSWRSSTANLGIVIKTLSEEDVTSEFAQTQDGDDTDKSE